MKNKNVPSLNARLDAFFDEWCATQAEAAKAIEQKDFEALRSHVSLDGVFTGGNYVNKAGNNHLIHAAELMLQRNNVELKVSLHTMRRLMIRAFFDYLPKVKLAKKFSADGIIHRAHQALSDLPRDDGLYVFPIVFAPRAVHTDFHIGPIRIVAKKILVSEIEERITADEREDELRPILAADWRSYIEGYDHFVVVKLIGFESDMAWSLGREAAEFALNLIRMLFRYYHTDDIRIGNGFKWEVQQSKLHLTSKGKILLSSSSGPWGTHLDDQWSQRLDDSLAGYSQMLASFALWFTQANAAGSPVYERLRYANQLISEAYAEPHDHIRLVRIISALEALALIARHGKAHQLGLHCAYAGGWNDAGRMIEIYEVVQDAYRWRSAVVHGDAPKPTDVRAAFNRIEPFLLSIFIGFLSIFSTIENECKPPSIKPLRKTLAAKIKPYFTADGTYPSTQPPKPADIHRWTEIEARDPAKR